MYRWYQVSYKYGPCLISLVSLKLTGLDSGSW
jgi:hypothetical protein